MSDNESSDVDDNSPIGVIELRPMKTAGAPICLAGPYGPISAGDEVIQITVSRGYYGNTDGKLRADREILTAVMSKSDLLDLLVSTDRSGPVTLTRLNGAPVPSDLRMKAGGFSESVQNDVEESIRRYAAGIDRLGEAAKTAGARQEMSTIAANLRSLVSPAGVRMRRIIAHAERAVMTGIWDRMHGGKKDTD